MEKSLADWPCCMIDGLEILVTKRSTTGFGLDSQQASSKDQ